VTCADRLHGDSGSRKLLGELVERVVREAMNCISATGTD
jgi:hypothetical protein